MSLSFLSGSRKTFKISTAGLIYNFKEFCHLRCLKTIIDLAIGLNRPQHVLHSHVRGHITEQVLHHPVELSMITAAGKGFQLMTQVFRALIPGFSHFGLANGVHLLIPSSSLLPFRLRTF